MFCRGQRNSEDNGERGSDGEREQRSGVSFYIVFLPIILIATNSIFVLNRMLIVLAARMIAVVRSNLCRCLFKTNF